MDKRDYDVEKRKERRNEKKVTEMGQHRKEEKRSENENKAREKMKIRWDI